MQKSVIEGPYTKRPQDRSGYATYKHPNGRWYQQRIANRGNETQGGRRRVRVAVLKSK